MNKLFNNRVRHVLELIAKDLRIEFRHREVLYTMVFFSVVVVLVFSFAFVREGHAIDNVAVGILWIAILFSGTIGISRTFDRERQYGTMRALLLSPALRSAIFISKMVSITLFMLLTQVVVIPLIAFLFDVPLLNHLGYLLLVIFLGILGIATVGTVFAAMMLFSPSREVLLPVVLYPVLIPLFIGATKATDTLLRNPLDIPVLYFWLKFLCVFNIVFLLIAVWSFEELVLE